MTTQMMVRVDPELKAKVMSIAKTEGKNVSEVVRELLTDYVRDRDIGAYVDNLWDRIGGKLTDRGMGAKEIQRVIKEVRAAQ
ncbi:MAG: ribbon-helix-helix protein, CopG family [Thermodesulfobacteriota bacterium]|nr:ribbon-helix-helix protein, CopG family [Thermodesulfobacteriota bacterium]